MTSQIQAKKHFQLICDDADLSKALETYLAGDSLVSLSHDEQKFQIRWVEPHVSGTPDHWHEGADCWIVTDEADNLLMVPTPLDGQSLPYLLRDRVREIAVYQNTMALNRAADESSLDESVEMHVNDTPGHGKPQLQANERTSLRVGNTGDQPVYVAVFESNSASEIGRLETVYLPAQSHQEITGWRFAIAEHVEFVSGPGPVSQPGQFKLFVSRQPIDWEWLLGSGSTALKDVFNFADWYLISLDFDLHGIVEQKIEEPRPEATVQTPSQQEPQKDKQYVYAGGSSGSVPTGLVEIAALPLADDLLASGFSTSRCLARSGSGGRGVGAGSASMQWDIADDALGHVVRCTDVNGLVSWHFPKYGKGSRSAKGGRAHFDIQPRRYGEKRRGLTGVILVKLVEEFVFPLVQEKVGEIVGEYLVRRWETKNRPHRIRAFDEHNYTDAQTPNSDAAFLKHLAQGKSLMFVHGTFGTAHGTFAGMPAHVLRHFNEGYDGRVCAFDHPTVSVTPADNLKELLDLLDKYDIELDVDLVCHSRGGLVGREMAERQRLLDRRGRINVDKLIFVGSPNAGTALVDSDYLGNLIDLYSNLMHLVPDNPVTDLMAPVLEVVKQMSLGVLGGLDGLQSMNPGGDYLKTLNDKDAHTQADYFAISANYDSVKENVKDYLHDVIIDGVFMNSHNDLVVPTAGVYEGNSAPGFPIPENAREIFDASDQVAHTTFFHSDRVNSALQRWLLG